MLPVIVSVHGGGWGYGDKERYQYYCMSLAQQGFAVVNFSYRLASKYKFPAPLEDTNRVFVWLLAHAVRYGFDTHNVFCVGITPESICWLCMVPVVPIPPMRPCLQCVRQRASCLGRWH